MDDGFPIAEIQFPYGSWGIAQAVLSHLAELDELGGGLSREASSLGAVRSFWWLRSQGNQKLGQREPLPTPASLAMLAVGALNPWRNDDASRRLQDRTSLLVSL